MYLTEAAKYRHLTSPYCLGVGVDIASRGDPVVPSAINFELPDELAERYGSKEMCGPIQLRGDALHLPFDSNSLDYVHCSHLLEDYKDWIPPLMEWVRVLKPGGYLVLLIPEVHLWNEAIAKGQPPNCSHRHEGQVGELTSYKDILNVTVLEDRLTACHPGDYSILFIARKN